MSPRALHVPVVLRRPLAGVARRHLAAALGSGLARLLLAALGLLAAQMLLDRALDLSRGARACLLALDLGVLGWMLFRRVITPWIHRWRADEAAFALQRRWPALGSRVISAVQLHSRLATGAGSPRLVEALVEETAVALAGLPVGQAVPLRPVFRLAACALLGLALGVAVAAWQPHATGILLRRVALSSVPLPTDTVVVPETRDLKTALGGALELAALAEGVLPAQGSVELVFDDGERRVVAVRPDAARPERFVFAAGNLRQSFRYRFSLGDGRGPFFDAAVLPAPAIERIEFTQEFPAYTGRLPLRQPAGALSLFAGARVRLVARLSEPVGSGELVFVGEGAPAPITLVVDPADPRTVRAEFTVSTTPFTGLSLPAVSVDGIPSAAPTVYPVRLELDAPPLVAVLAPAAAEESLVPSARLPISIRIIDTFGVDKAELVVESPTIGQTRVPLTPDADGRVVHDLVPVALDARLAAGEALSWWIEATDNNDVTGPGIGRSERRLLTLVTLAQKQTEMLRRLEETSRRLEDVARRQGEVREDIGEILRRATPAETAP